MNIFSIMSAVSTIAPMISQACHLAQDMFPDASGQDKKNFVLQFLDEAYPPDAKQKAEFAAIRPYVEFAINAAVALWKKTSPTFVTVAKTETK